MRHVKRSCHRAPLHFLLWRYVSSFIIFIIIVIVIQFEADRRAFIITINSFGTELSRDDRFKLYPRCGKLNPDGLHALSRADDYEQVKAVAEFYSVSIIWQIPLLVICAHSDISV